MIRLLAAAVVTAAAFIAGVVWAVINDDLAATYDAGYTTGYRAGIDAQGGR